MSKLKLKSKSKAKSKDANSGKNSGDSSSTKRGAKHGGKNSAKSSTKRGSKSSGIKNVAKNSSVKHVAKHDTKNGTSSAAPQICEERNVYRACRLKADANSKDRLFKSQKKAAKRLALANDDERNCHVSAASLKDYERGKTVPTAHTVMLMADVYGTPELKWLHCTKSCPIGRNIIHASETLGDSSIRSTYFDLTGAFRQVGRVQDELHDVIAAEHGGSLGIQDMETINDILAVLDNIAESTLELKVWIEKHAPKPPQE